MLQPGFQIKENQSDVCHILLFLVYLLTAISTSAQAPDIKWAKKAGGTSWDMGYSIATDSEGNSYITGDFSGTATFGNITLVSTSFRDIYIAKLDADGNYLWAVRAGGTHADVGYGIALDETAGYCYVVGNCSGDSDFGKYQYDKTGQYYGFIARYNLDGEVLRVFINDHWHPWAVAVDYRGKPVTCGTFSEQITISNRTYISEGTSDLMIAMFSNTQYLKPIWGVPGNVSEEQWAYGICTDLSGNTYATGSYKDQVTFGNYTKYGIGRNVFLLKLNSNGIIQWLQVGGGQGDEDGYDVAADNDGNVYITGAFEQAATFSGEDGNKKLITSKGFTDGFLVKYNTSGNVIWAKRFGSSQSHDRGWGIAIDDDNKIFLGGYFCDQADFGSYTMDCTGYWDTFIAKVNTSGIFKWVVGDGTSDEDYARDVSTDSYGNVYSTGGFKGGDYFGNDFLNSSGIFDIHVIRVGSVPPVRMAWWTDEIDEDNDAYVRSAKLHWKMGMDGSGSWRFITQVSKRVMGQSSWTNVGTTNKQYQLPGSLQGEMTISGGEHNLYEFKISFLTETADFITAIDSEDDTDLSDYKMETEAQDEPGEEEVSPPPNIVALSGYDNFVPVAWKAPNQSSSGSRSKTIPSDLYHPNSSQNPIKSASKTDPQFMQKTKNKLSKSDANTLTYNVYRTTSSGGDYYKVAYNLSHTYYRDQFASNGQTYYYKVTAEINETESTFSPTANATPTENGYQVNLRWAAPIPTIDGILSTGEWSNAGSCNIIYPGESGTITMYLMNDENYLYLAVDDPTDTNLDTYDTIGLFFDEDYNRIWPASANGAEGLLRFYYENSETTAWYQGFYGTWPDISGQSWAAVSGVNAAISATSGHLQYEARIDLENSPVNPADKTMGWGVYMWEGSSSQISAIWPQELASKLEGIWADYTWMHAPFSYGDLILSDDQTSQGHWADIDGDGDVDIVDIQKVAAHYGQQEGDPGWEPKYDVDGDGDVDIVDIQKVAAWYGQDVSG